MLEIEVSFITINYNSSHYTNQLIESIRKYTKCNYEIIIVDNDSKVEDFKILNSYIQNNPKNIRLVQNDLNRGFASGNMLGYSYATGKYIFFLNNDTILLNDVSSYFIDYLSKHSEVGLATGKVQDEKGNFSSSYKLFPSLTKELFGNTIARKFSKYHFPSNRIVLKEPSLVEVVSGSCMFFRKTIFEKIGGFDTNFFLYCEEEDISKRVWNHNNKVVFLPEAEILHFSGGSTEKSFAVKREYYISYHILMKKHFNILSILILRLLLLFKLLRRSFKGNGNFKLFLCALQGCPKKNSIGYKLKA